MNKKETYLVLNNEGIIRNDNISNKHLYFKKQFKFQLPKISNSSSFQVIGQKTIAKLIESLEKINKDPKSQLYPLLSQCIKVLKGDKFLKRELLMRKIEQRELLGKENQIQANQGCFISKSQAINVEKPLIRKVQSKQLFQKVSKASYIKPPKISDSQLIIELNNKIKEKDNLIRELHTRIDELNQSLNKEKELMIVQNHSKQLILDQKQELCKQNAIQYFKMKEMNQNLKKLNEVLNQNASKNNKLAEKCKIFEVQIKERQNQITSLWQIAILNSSKQ